MTIGLRELLLVVAIVLFVLAALSNGNWSDLVAFGLACMAGAQLAGGFSFGRRRR